MLKSIYTQKDFPVLQNRVYESEEDAKNCIVGDIEIVQDPNSGLIFNSAFDPNLLHYDENYNNEQSHSPNFKHHLQEIAFKIEKNLGSKNLVEVGCGKGVFLEMLIERGIDIAGFDPTYNGSNPRIVKKFFEPDLVNRANGLILRHVLEHIKDPVEFLFQIREANSCEGLIYIEVPCFDWICQNLAWYDIFYEHVNYFRLIDFHRMFDHIIDIGKCFGGQYIYVVADLSSLKSPMADGSEDFHLPVNFLDSLYKSEDSIDYPVCIWGGGSKGVIFSLLRMRVGYPVDIVIDINPSKQGKYLPVTGLKIDSPKEGIPKLKNINPIYVMNSNYLEEIRMMSGDCFTYLILD